MLLPAPFRFRKTRKCDRCGLRTPSLQPNCQHCENISDGKDLDDVVQRWNESHEGNKNLGLMFVVVSLIILVAVAIAVL